MFLLIHLINFIMSKFYCEPVLACTADGRISRLDAETMRHLVAECRKDNESVKDAGEKAKRMISIAEICRTNGYVATALGLYRDAVGIIEEDACRTWSHKNKELMYIASRGIDSIMPASPSAYDKAVCFYMELYDEYLYNILNVDNEALLMRIMRFKKKHNIKYSL